MAFRAVRWTISALLAAWSPFAMADFDEPSDLKAINLRTHSLAIPYMDDDLTSRWFNYGGTTVIRTDQYIRLTSEQPGSAGWIFSRLALTATNWEIEVEFKISGQGSLHGDGMAMWVVKEPEEMGPVFGMKDRFEGLAIFFDTYKNNRPGTVFPYVMAMVGDGQTPYDQANDGKANELAGCSARGLRNSDVPTKAKVRYFHDKQLTLDLQYKDEDEWTRCFEIMDIKLPSPAHLGFSAETGELSDNHDIIRVDARNLYSPSGSLGGNTAGGRDAKRRKGGARRKSSWSFGGIFWAFLKVILFVAALGLAYVGFTAYRTRRRDRF